MNGLIFRAEPRQLVEAALQRSQVVALLGPRQCGKTTLARTFNVPDSNYFDLERTADRAALAVSAESTLGGPAGTGGHR